MYATLARLALYPSDGSVQYTRGIRDLGTPQHNVQICNHHLIGGKSRISLHFSFIQSHLRGPFAGRRTTTTIVQRSTCILLHARYYCMYFGASVRAATRFDFTGEAPPGG